MMMVNWFISQNLQSPGCNELVNLMTIYSNCKIKEPVYKLPRDKLENAKSELSSFISWCRMKHQSCAATVPTTKSMTICPYYNVMATLLSTYLDVVILLSRTFSPKELKHQSQELCTKVFYTLSPVAVYSLDILIQATCIKKIDSNLVGPLCKKCLMELKNTDELTYTKYLIVAKKFGLMFYEHTKDALIKCSKILPPKNYLSWISQTNFNVYNSLWLKSSENIDKWKKYLMNDVPVELLCQLVNPVPLESPDHDPMTTTKTMKMEDHIGNQKAVILKGTIMETEGESEDDDDDDDVTNIKDKNDANQVQSMEINSSRDDEDDVQNEEEEEDDDSDDDDNDDEKDEDKKHNIKCNEAVENNGDNDIKINVVTHYKVNLKNDEEDDDEGDDDSSDPGLLKIDENIEMVDVNNKTLKHNNDVKMINITYDNNTDYHGNDDDGNDDDGSMNDNDKNDDNDEINDEDDEDNKSMVDGSLDVNKFDKQVLYGDLNKHGCNGGVTYDLHNNNNITEHNIKYNSVNNFSEFDNASDDRNNEVRISNCNNLTITMTTTTTTIDNNINTTNKVYHEEVDIDKDNEATTEMVFDDDDDDDEVNIKIQNDINKFLNVEEENVIESKNKNKRNKLSLRKKRNVVEASVKDVSNQCDIEKFDDGEDGDDASNEIYSQNDARYGGDDGGGDGDVSLIRQTPNIISHDIKKSYNSGDNEGDDDDDDDDETSNHDDEKSSDVTIDDGDPLISDDINYLHVNNNNDHNDNDNDHNDNDNDHNDNDKDHDDNDKDHDDNNKDHDDNNKDHDDNDKDHNDVNNQLLQNDDDDGKINNQPHIEMDIPQEELIIRPSISRHVSENFKLYEEDVVSKDGDDGGSDGDVIGCKHAKNVMMNKNDDEICDDDDDNDDVILPTQKRSCLTSQRNLFTSLHKCYILPSTVSSPLSSSPSKKNVENKRLDVGDENDDANSESSRDLMFVVDSSEYEYDEITDNNNMHADNMNNNILNNYKESLENNGTLSHNNSIEDYHNDDNSNDDINNSNNIGISDNIIKKTVNNVSSPRKRHNTKFDASSQTDGYLDRTPEDPTKKSKLSFDYSSVQNHLNVDSADDDQLLYSVNKLDFLDLSMRRKQKNYFTFLKLKQQESEVIDIPMTQNSFTKNNQSGIFLNNRHVPFQNVTLLCLKNLRQAGTDITKCINTGRISKSKKRCETATNIRKCMQVNKSIKTGLEDGLQQQQPQEPPCTVTVPKSDTHVVKRNKTTKKRRTGARYNNSKNYVDDDAISLTSYESDKDDFDDTYSQPSRIRHIPTKSLPLSQYEVKSTNKTKNNISQSQEISTTIPVVRNTRTRSRKNSWNNHMNMSMDLQQSTSIKNCLAEVASKCLKLSNVLSDAISESGSSEAGLRRSARIRKMHEDKSEVESFLI